MANIRVRAFDVQFGDAIFVTVPDRDPETGEETDRHILIDMGNVLQGTGSDVAVFKPAYDAIMAALKGKPLDLYVMTHEHLDHVKGLQYLATKYKNNGRLPVKHVWLTGSSHPEYYQTHERARVQKKLALDAYRGIAARLGADPGPFGSLLANNNPLATGGCVAHLRKLAPKNTWYVHRGIDLEGKHPFREAKLQIWAPEEDTADYYGKFQPMAFDREPTAHEEATALPTPPAGVDAGAFYNLVDHRRNSAGDNLFNIDKAANNTSVVFSLEWRGRRLLFCGDAELRSWKEMARQKVFKPVDFIKVAHHGSHNGTPPDEELDMLVPADGKKRWALISTCRDTYSGIPHPPTDARLSKRCELVTTLTAGKAGHVEVEIGEAV